MQKIIIFLIVVLCIASGYYTMSHASLYGERIFIMSDDGEIAMILEAYRTEIFGIAFSHHYTISSLRGDKTAVDTIEHYSFARDIEPYGALIEYHRADQYEMASAVLSGTIDFGSGDVLSFSSSTLTADFTTKTNPDYWRYMSTGTGILSLGGEQKPMHIMFDSIIAPTATESGLREGTKIRGYF